MPFAAGIRQFGRNASLRSWDKKKIAEKYKKYTIRREPVKKQKVTRTFMYTCFALFFLKKFDYKICRAIWLILCYDTSNYFSEMHVNSAL